MRLSVLAASTTRVLLAESLVVPSGLVTAAYLGRALGPELYGLFSVAMSVGVTLEWVLATLVGRTTVKLVSQADDWRPVASTILILHIAVGAAVSVVCLVCAGPLSGWLGDARLGPWIALVSLEVPIGVTAAACRNIMTGRGNYRGRAMATSTRWLLRPLTIIALVELGFGVTGAMVGSVLAAAAGWVVAVRTAGVPVLTGRLTPLPGVWQLAAPVFVLSLSLRVFDKLGLLSVQALSGSPLESGFFAAAQNLAIAPGLVALSFSPVLLAELTRLHVRSEGAAVGALVTASMKLVLAVLPLAAIGAAASHEIMPLIYGAGFAPAAPLAWPLIGAASMMLLVSVTTSVLIACDRAGLAAHTVWPWVVPTLVALAVFVPQGGAWAAALVTAAAIAASAVASLWAVARATRFLPPWPTVARSLALALVLGVVSAWWSTPGLWVVAKLALLGVLTPLLFAATGEFSRQGTEAATGVDTHAGAYWDGIASDWKGPGSDPWRQHADRVNLATCDRWWPNHPVGRVLKTDVFDEVAGHGLLPDLQARAGAAMAIDRSLEAARLARTLRGASAIGADVRALPFADAAFDLVISNSTLDHFDRLDDIRLALGEIRRVLAPGGRLILTLDNPRNPAIRLRNALPFELLQRLGLVPYFVGITLDARQAAAMLESLGFRVIESTAVLHCPRALAIAALKGTRSLGGAAWQQRLARGLMWFEGLERWPSRHHTGYYVALAADVEPR